MRITAKDLGLQFALAFLLPSLQAISLAVAGQSAIPIILIPMENACIRSDGTIEPPTLPIQRSGSHYMLTDDIINHTIQIQKDKVIFDGNGHSLLFVRNGEIPEPYVYAEPAINITNQNNIIIKKVTFDTFISGGFTAVSILNSSNIIVLEDSARDLDGVHIESSRYCSVIGNNFSNQGVGIEIFRSTCVRVAFNNISAAYGGIMLQDTNSIEINRNDFRINDYSVLVVSSAERNNILYGFNVNTSIVENNFFDNDAGVRYKGPANMSDSDTIFNNYWSGNKVNIENVHDYGLPYPTSAVDQAPLNSSIPISFNLTSFPIPIYESNPNETSTAQNNSENGSQPIEIALVFFIIATLSIIASIVLLKQIHNRRHY